MISDQFHTSESIRPSRYQIRERLFKLGNSFKIKDGLGHNRYTVRSKMWTLGKKLVLEDINGK